MEKNLTGTAKSCVHPPAQLPSILVTRPSAAPLADLRPASLGPGARESAFLKWVTLQRSTLPQHPPGFAWGQQLPSEEGGQISREGLASLEKENTFHLAHLSSPLTCMMLLLGLGGALWVSSPRDLGSVAIPPWTCKAVQEWMRRKKDRGCRCVNGRHLVPRWSAYGLN